MSAKVLQLPGRDELLDELLAQAVDVHLPPPAEPFQPLDELLGAGRVHAVDPRLARRLLDRPAAVRAGLWRDDRHRARRPLGLKSTRTTCGMISPAFSITTVSPTRTSSRSTCSMLCSPARRTVVPATNTGSNSATGVSVPFLPTCQVTALSVRRRLLGRVLVRDAPPRRLAPVAQPLPRRQVVGPSRPSRRSGTRARPAHRRRR